MDNVGGIIVSAFVALAINFIFSGVIKDLTSALAPNSTVVEVGLFLILNILMTITSFYICFCHLQRHKA